MGPERILPAQQFAFTSAPNNDGRASNDNTYAIGDEVLVQVTFSTDVTVTGSPRLELNVGGGDGKPASYSGRSWRLMVPWLVRSGGGEHVNRHRRCGHRPRLPPGADNHCFRGEPVMPLGSVANDRLRHMLIGYARVCGRLMHQRVCRESPVKGDKMT